MRKKVLSTILVLCMVLALVPTIAFAADFTDTEGNWAEAAIDRWSDEGVVNGDDNGKFNPDKGMTRAEFAQTVVNLMKLKGEADLSAFTDVDPDEWYVDALEAVKAAEIMNGDSATTMSPDGELSREMMFVMIARALGVKEAETSTKTIPDIDEAEDWAVGSINALVNMGVLNGTDDLGSVEPAAFIERAAVVTVLNRLIGGYGNEDGDTVEIVPDTITLIVADNVTVTGEADPDLPIIVAGEATKVNVKDVTGEATVVVTVDDVAVQANPGTTVSAGEGVTGVTANGHQVAEDNSYTIPTPTPVTPGSSENPPAETKNKYTVTVTADPEEGGSVTVDPATETIEEGTEVTITVTANAHYTVKSVTVDGEEVTLTDGKYTFTITKNTTVDVTFTAVPSIQVGDNKFYWDDDEEEWVSEDGKEFLDPKEFLDQAEKDQEEFYVDGKEYWYDDAKEKWFNEDGEEFSQEQMEGMLHGGDQTSDPVPGQP